MVAARYAVGVVRVGIGLLSCLLVACTERQLLIRTDPPGARVRVNGKPLGRTKRDEPLIWRFDHYGEVLLEAEFTDHDKVHRPYRLKMPWWQRTPIDFVPDVIIPWTIRDTHRVTLELPKHPEMTPEEVQRRIEHLEKSAAKTRKVAEGP